jgi:NAD(P)H-dependent FMN reductase
VGVSVVIFDGLRMLPQFDLDLEANGPLPVVERWRQAIAGADALLVACPEYGFSLPGALKNAIDWVIGSGELESKVVGVTAAVNHPDRGRRGLAALCDTLRAVNATIVGGAPILRDERFDTEVAALVRALISASASAREIG